MITVLFHKFIFLFITYAYGIFFLKKIIKVNKSRNFYETSLIGLIITLIISQFLNFFVPLNDYLLIANIILLVVFFFLNKKLFLENFNVDYKIFILLFIFSIFNIYGSGFSDDLDHYHYSFISNSDELNLIWGLSYLHPLYGTMPIWLSGHSFFNFDYSRLQDIHVLNGLILFLVTGLFLNEISNKKLDNKFLNPFLFSILLFILFKYTRLKEFGVDRPAILLFCFLIFYYLKYFLSENEKILKNFIIVSLISITIVSIKVIYLPVMILPFLVFLKKRSELLVIDLKYFTVFFALIIFLSKNVLATGCLIYPLDVSCIDALSWSDSIRIKEFALSQEVVNKAWSSYTGNLSKEVFIKDFNWINVWFNRGKVEIFELLLTILFFIIITFFTFSFNLTNILKKNENLKLFNLFLIFTIISSLLIYFLKNPVIRMNHHFLISIMLIIISFFCNFEISKIKKNFLIFFLVFGLAFNFYKNYNRISENSFVNNPQLMISHKIVPQVEKKIDNFIYYMGWYGKTPISNNYLDKNNYKKIKIFDVIF